jgi:conjugative transposon TraN protein
MKKNPVNPVTKSLEAQTKSPKYKPKIMLMRSLHIFYLSLFFQTLSMTKLTAQTPQPLKSEPLSVTYNKTVTLIFNSPIQSVDIGSDAIIADKYEGIENLLRVKANTKNFKETSLTIITKDGKYHSYLVTYTDQPITLGYKMDTTTTPNPATTATFDNTRLNESELTTTAQKIIQRGQKVKHRGSKKYNMTFALRSLYIKQDLLFLNLRIQNKTNINYDIDFIKFYVRDKEKTKRTAIQEIEITPLYTYTPENPTALQSATTTILGQKIQDQVITLQKLTIPNSKVLEIEIYEKNGSRNLKFTLDYYDILKAQPIN